MRFMRALFETQFEPHDGGYVFYPTVWSGGRPVSAAEFDAMDLRLGEVGLRERIGRDLR